MGTTEHEPPEFTLPTADGTVSPQA